MAIDFPATSGQATDGSYTHTASGITWAWDGTTWKAQGITSSYVLPTASATVIGGVKVGTGLSINSSTSVLSADSIALDGLSDVSTSGVNSGEILKYNGSSWAPAADNSGASALTIKDEGTDKTTAASSIDFVGAGVTATNSGTDVTVTIPGGSGSPEITWTLTANGSSDYVFSGDGFPSSQNDPTLYLMRGQTYKFTNNTGGHPFRIQSTTATSGGGTAYNDGVTNQDATGATNQTLTFVVPMNAPDTLYYQCTAHPAMFGTINILTQGSSGGTGLGSRQTFTATTASLANNVAGNVDVTAYKSYSLLKIKPSIAAWVTLYVDAAARTADANRVQGADPAPDAGVIAEVITTTANEEIKMSPGVLGWHQDGGNDAVNTVFCKVVNKSGSTGTCTVSLTVVQLEA